MYFAFVFGALGVMRWLVCAANYLRDALLRRPAMSGVRFHGTKQIR
jgi:hypothetical protein